jgi:[citrate (pro-3S)-lyase] ligase
MFDVRDIYTLSVTDALYAETGIMRPDGCDETVGIFSGKELIGCASIKGDTLAGFAISPRAQGEGLLATLCTELIKRGLANGHTTLYVFTKPETALLFEACGFRKIAEALPYTAMLEWGRNSVARFASGLEAAAAGKPANAGCIVMNANPFTLGHRYLAALAAGEMPHLYILVVEEDKSDFPFAERLRLVREGLADLDTVTVIPGGKYVISQLTFPTYFLKHTDVNSARAELDVHIFGKYIAPALRVSTRYIGTEPYCRITGEYNTVMAKLLPEYGVAVREITRKQSRAWAISASTVRRIIREGKTEETRELVPQSTYAFLQSEAGLAIQQRLRQKA